MAASVMGGCATYQPSAQVSASFTPRDTVPALPEMARAHERGPVEFVAAADGAQIPVRVFGAGGAKRPVLMTHGLESHSGWFVQSGAFLAGLGHPVYLVDRRGSGLSRQRRGHVDDFREWSAERYSSPAHWRWPHPGLGLAGPPSQLRALRRPKTQTKFLLAFR